MSVNDYMDVKAVWYRNDETPVNITEQFISATTSEDNEPETNTCNLVVQDDDIFYTGSKLQLKEGDTIIVWSKRAEDNSWDGVFTDDEIMWYGTFVDYSKTLSPDGEQLSLKVNDLTYVLFNRFWSKSYEDLNMRTDEILIDVLSNQVENVDGTGALRLNFDNVARFRNDSSQFPVLSPNLKLKPVQEWVQELSGRGYTNDPEDPNDNVMTEKMVFRLRGPSVYWYEPSSDIKLTIDDTSVILDLKEESKNGSSVNFLILDCGEDFDGEPIYYYAVDKNSGSEIIKERYEHQLKIAGLNKDYDNAFDQLRKNYSLSTNADFRDKVRQLAQRFSDTWFDYKGRARKVVNVTVPYTPLNIGDIVYIDIKGFSNKKYRTTSLSHTVSSRDGSTQLQLEAEI